VRATIDRREHRPLIKSRTAINSMSTATNLMSTLSTMVKSNVAAYPSECAQVGMGVVAAGMALMQRSHLFRSTVDPCTALLDEVEALNFDVTIRDAFLKIQAYRDINVPCFSMAIRNVDCLLFLERLLTSGTVTPLKKDKATAFAYFRVAVSRLNTFQHLVQHALENEHAMTVSIYIAQIYTNLQKHLLNVLHLCSVFKPAHMLKRAADDVQVVMKRYARKSTPLVSELERDIIEPSDSISGQIYQQA
jgi:hypothetical protein